MKKNPFRPPTASAAPGNGAGVPLQGAREVPLFLAAAAAAADAARWALFGGAHHRRRRRWRQRLRRCGHQAYEEAKER
eukprot:CAMPEP_0115206026 /NCGR_PEP_ID=MMETSP0270-20121206/19991_1 /TAXON_ID=71861 /ORGANISM="Scrippsiella trochoidea, Strain CCMP3099" /LENGTH=77 /DNA_ID=CAMNT_0002619581 /DNA_START=942 /DNA_END=1172 /DNA_ORIENTATION=-